MRFLKEYVMLVLIIVFVILIEIITDNITYKSLKEINIQIENLEKALETDEVKDKISSLCSSWKDKEKKLAFYMEHDELEKVSVLVNNVNSDIQNDNMEDINKEIDEIKFILEHIKQKQKLELRNIF